MLRYLNDVLYDTEEELDVLKKYSKYLHPQVSDIAKKGESNYFDML